MQIHKAYTMLWLFIHNSFVQSLMASSLYTDVRKAHYEHNIPLEGPNNRKAEAATVTPLTGSSVQYFNGPLAAPSQ